MEKEIQKEKDFTSILNSNLFDSEYYAKQTGTEFLTLPDAISHYLDGGWEKKYSPCLLFDSYYYLLQIGLELNKNQSVVSTAQNDKEPEIPLSNDDLFELAIENLKKSETSPLEHYLKTGSASGLKPHPLFDEAYYRSQFQDLDKNENLFIHFATTGYKENISPHRLFDKVYYEKNNPELSTENLFLHYLNSGYLNNSKPNSLFDGDYYYKTNADVKDAGLNPLSHYVLFGYKENRNPHPLFDTEFYYKQCPELKDTDINPLTHYLYEGFKIGKDPNSLFSSSFYLNTYTEVQEAGINPLVNYVEMGYKVPRDPHPLFDSYYYRHIDPNIVENDLNPLVHYLENANEFPVHNPNLVFENLHYINKYSDVKEHQLNPLSHFVQYGKFESRTPGGRIEYALNQVNHNQNNVGKLDRDNWRNGHFCIVSHEASRTGAPLIILKIVKWLTEKYRFKCTIVLLKGGDLVEDFKKYGTTYLVEDMGLSVDHLTPTIIATFLTSIFKNDPLFTIVNSATSHQVCAGLTRLGFPYYCLTHEFADPYRPEELKNMLKAKHVFVPSNIVQHSFERKDGIEPEYLSKISVLRQGVLIEEFGEKLTKSEARKIWMDELKTTNTSPEIESIKNEIAENEETLLTFKAESGNLNEIEELKDSIKKSKDQLELLKSDISINENTKIILASGVAHGRKGIDIFYNIIVNVLRKNNGQEDIVFAWLGHYNATNYDSIEFWINYDLKKLGLDKKVIFTGNKTQEEVEIYFKGADLFLLTSRMDPFPCVTLEAMACNLPVVGFENATGSTEIIAGKTDCVFPYLDIEKISDGIIKLVKDEAKVQEIGKENKEIVLRDFHFENYVDEMVNFIEKNEGIEIIKQRKNLINDNYENTKPKVIALCTDWGLSGVNSVLEAMGKQLAKEDIDFSILFSQSEDHVHRSAHGGDGKVVLPQLPYEYLESNGTNIKEWWADLIGYFEGQAPCILLTTFDFSGSSIISALSNNVGAITWVQSDDPDYYEQTNRLGRYCNSIAVVSSYLKESISGLNPLFADSVSVVYNTTVTKDEVIESRTDIKTSDKLRMIYTGRLVQYQKRVLDFIDIVKELDKTNVDYQLTLAGQDTTGGKIEGKLKEDLKEHIKDGRVRLTGRISRDELFIELQNHDLFLLISDFEGLPLSVVEGMSQGCVPIVSDMKSGTKELVLDKKTGFVLDTRDYAKWVELLLELHNDREKLYEFSKEASKHIVEKFTVEKSGKQFAGIIKDIHNSINTNQYQRPSVIKAHNKTGDVLISQYLHGHKDLV